MLHSLEQNMPTSSLLKRSILAIFVHLNLRENRPVQQWIRPLTEKCFNINLLGEWGHNPIFIVRRKQSLWIFYFPLFYSSSVFYWSFLLAVKPLRFKLKRRANTGGLSSYWLMITNSLAKVFKNPVWPPKRLEMI